MIALLQRVREASVQVSGATIAAIGPGLVVFVCVERGDSEAQAERLAERILTYRVFGDGAGRMNLSVAAVSGELLLVPQFTLAADTRKGTRPSLGRAAPPEQGRVLFSHLVGWLRSRHSKVQTGSFGSYMRVALINDGPVTFWLEAPPGAVSSKSDNTGG